MKLLFVSPYFHPKVGGLEKYVLNIAKRLSKQHEVIVVTTGPGGKRFTETIEGCKVYRLPIAFKISNTPINLAWKTDLYRIFRSEKPDLVNIHIPVPFLGDLAARVAKQLNIPYIITYHAGSMKKDNSPFLNILINLYEKEVLPFELKNAKKIICSSDFVRKTFLKSYKNVHVVNPGVNLSLFKPGKKISKGFNILYIGKIDTTASWKGLDYLFQAFDQLQNKHSDISLTLVGGGNLLNKYKGRHPNVKFTGVLLGKDRVKPVHNCDVLVLPSTSTAESFGMVLAEANACGKPIIGSKIGGIPYVIKHNYNGLLVPPKDSEALAKSLEKLYKDNKLAKKLGSNGLKKVKQNWNWDNIAKKTLELFLKA